VYARRILAPIKPIAFKLLNRKKEKFLCPICGYSGPFVDVNLTTGTRQNVQCPRCNGAERHRIQWLTLDRIQSVIDFSKMDVLHFAPEPFLKQRFKQSFKSYTTADLSGRDVDHQADLSQLQFADASYDFVYASHVFEHIKEDMKAISEVRRILRPKGVAILPVPVVGERTVEYPAPNPAETNHVRAPGADYFDRYRKFFSEVKVFRSEDFDPKHQTFLCEDRTRWPTLEMPLRQPSVGTQHADFVPVCFA
jgi:predicted SAM-dependent methyltransferase